MGCCPSRNQSANEYLHTDPVSRALQNDLILAHVSGFLPFSDLKVFRLVNRTWNRVSLPTIRNKTRMLDLTVNDVSEMYRRYLFSEGKLAEANSKDIANSKESTDLCIRRLKCYRALIDLIRSSNIGFPCSKFRIEMDLSIYYFDHEQQLLKELLLAISGFATELTLVSGERFVWNETPNLAFLSLRTFQVFHVGKSVTENDNRVNLLQHIAENAPLLDTVHLINSSGTTDFFGNIINTLNITQRGKIKTLIVHGLLNDDHLSRLTGLELKLHSFTLGFLNESKFSSLSLYVLLNSQSDNLAQLSIGFINTSGVSTVMFPVMRKLGALKIGQNGPIMYPELCYATQFPVLNQLSLMGMNFITRELFNSTMRPLATVTTLDVQANPENPEILEEMARIFPNVRKLTTCVTTACLIFLEQLMRNIEDLTMIGNSYTEEDNMLSSQTVLTGLYHTELQAVWSQWQETNELMADEYRRYRPDLHGLKVLRLENCIINDFVCLLGLMDLRSLRCLDLQNCQNVQDMISQDVIEIMSEKFLVILPASYEPASTVEENGLQLNDTIN